MKLALCIVYLCLFNIAFCLPNFGLSDENMDTLSSLLDEMKPEKKISVMRALMDYHQKSQQNTCDEFFCHDPDCGKNVTQLITSKGYPCEDHYALTPDGYWLSMQRIPYGRNGDKSSGKPIVFLQHGLEDASHTWVINSAEESLGFILADHGYDVWMGNSRGNTYSNRNEFYKYDDSDFWNFSWDEMANIDLPTQVNYALEYSGQSDLYYIGHSQGTLQGFTGFQNATMASKIKLFVALAPVYYVGHISGFLRILADFDIDVILEDIGWNKFLVQHCWLDNLLDEICDIDNAEVCQIGMCAIAGCNPTNLNGTRFDVYMQLDPAGTSVQNVNHWGQMVRQDNCCYYDFGRHGNNQHYGQSDPPCYDVSKMAAPVALFSGGLDILGDPEDVSTLLSQLNPDMIKYSTQIGYYEHMDFVWGMDAHTVIYPEVLSLLEQFK